MGEYGSAAAKILFKRPNYYKNAMKLPSLNTQHVNNVPRKIDFVKESEDFAMTRKESIKAMKNLN